VREPNWLDNAFSFELSDDGELIRLMFRQEYSRAGSRPTVRSTTTGATTSPASSRS
jgi:hypothetical protein